METHKSHPTVPNIFSSIPKNSNPTLPVRSNVGDPPPAVSIHVSTQLQFDMVAESPLSQVSGAIAGSLNKSNGSSQLFYMSSTSVLNAYQLETDGEWIVEDTRIPSGSGPAAIATKKSGDLLFMMNQSHNLYVLDLTKKFPVWKSLGVIPNSEGFLDLRVTSDTDKNTIAVVISTTGNYHKAYQVDLNGNWTVDQIFIGLMQGTVYDVQVSAAYGDPAIQSSWGYYMAGKVATQGNQDCLVTLNSMVDFGTLTVVSVGTYNSVASLTTDIPGSSYLFAIDSNAHVQYFQPTPSTSPPFTAVSIAPGIACSSVVVGRRLQQKETGSMPIPEVVIIGTNGKAYHISPADGAVSDSTGVYVVSSWNSASQIAQNIVNVVVEQDSSADPIYYMSTTDLGVNLLSLDPTTGEWGTQNIELPSSSSTATTQMEVYYLNITAKNSNTEPIVGGICRVSTDGYNLMEVNGRQYRIDANRPLATVLSSTGKLCVTSICNKKIGSPIYSVYVDGMDPEDIMDVNPAGDVQNKFKNISSADLLGATNQSTGAQTITGANRDQAVIDAVVSGLQQTGGMAAALHATSVNERKYLHSKVKSEVARIRKRTDPSMNKIDATKLNEGGFRMSFKAASEGHPAKVTHHSLTAAEGTALIEQWKVQFSIFGVSWGDIVDGISNAWYTVVDFVVNTVGGAIQAAIQVIVDGVTQVWNGIVSAVNQILDAAQMIFNSIKVFFEDLYYWLCFLFDWDDIKATQNELSTRLFGFTDTMTTFVNTWLPDATASVFQKVHDWIQNQFSVLESTLAGKTWSQWDSGNDSSSKAFGSFKALGSSESSFDDLPSSAFWFIDKVMNGFGGGFNGLDFGSAAEPVIQAYEAIKNSINSTTTQTDWQNFLTSLQNLGSVLTSRSVMDSSPIINILEVIKTGALLCLDGVNALVVGFNSLLSSIIGFWVQILNAPLNIPIVSPIYKWITGDDLTTANFCTLLLAIPVTIGYKLFFNAAPFPTSARSLAHSKKLGLLGSVSVEVVLIRCAAFVKFIGFLFDIGVDTFTLMGKESPLWLRICNNLVIPLAAAVFTFNYRQNFGKEDIVQQLSLGLWIAGLVPFVMNLGAMVSSKGKLDITSNPVGVAMLGFIGVGLVGTGIAFTVVSAQNNEYVWQASADAICDPLPYCFKWLALTKNEFAGALLILIDLLPGFVVVLARASIDV